MKSTIFRLLLIFVFFVFVSLNFADEKNHSEVAEKALNHYVSWSLNNWYGSGGKVQVPRSILARLELGKDLQSLNEYIQGLEPWGTIGSSYDLFWGLISRNGDYDFTLVVLTSMLYLYGEDAEVLYAETRDHLLNNLLVLDGGKPDISVPGIPIRDTENHILMNESSRYLKNQWLFNHGSEDQRGRERYDNSENGLEEWMVRYLEAIYENGFHEFNSIPYQIYSIQPLLNLEAFAESERVRKISRKILDGLAAQYALGSFQFRRFVPYRRSERHVRQTTFYNDRLTAVMVAWLEDPYNIRPDIWNNVHALLPTVLLPYRPSKELENFLLREPHKRCEYFVRYVHGKVPRPESFLDGLRPLYFPNPSIRGSKGTPEIFSGGPGFLLSAGGAFRGGGASVYPRKTTLFLADGADDVNDCFHIPGQGYYNRRPFWNNTGVYERFAVGPEPVHIPESYKPVSTGEGWKIFEPYESKPFFIAIFNQPDLGLMALFPDYEGSASQLLKHLQEKNPDPDKLHRMFKCPTERCIEYEPTAPVGLWLIKSVNGKLKPRIYDRWPQGFKHIKSALKSIGS